jgi:hypothetical protein
MTNDAGGLGGVLWGGETSRLLGPLSGEQRTTTPTTLRSFSELRAP